MSVKDMRIYNVGDKLTDKQRLWIDEYIKTNNYTTASRNAGYKGTDNNLKHIGYENSKRFANILAVRRQELNQQITSNNIAELTDIQEFWTKVFNDDNEFMKNRLRASELLAKSKGGFIEKKEVKVVDTDWFIEDN